MSKAESSSKGKGGKFRTSLKDLDARETRKVRGGGMRVGGSTQPTQQIQTQPQLVKGS